jgi:tetratricopeptide (TPR) repeat protein
MLRNGFEIGFRFAVCFALIVFFGIGPTVAQERSTDKLSTDGDAATKQPKSDDPAIREAIAQFGGREEASRALADQGWSYVRDGKFDLAMERFKQSLLLNAKNYQSFWGMGAVLSGQGKLDESIEQLETAKALVDDPKQEVGLLTDIGAVQSEYAARLPEQEQLERARHFVSANRSFSECLDMDPDYAPGWRGWAISLYEQERYSEAWIKAERAIALKAEPFPNGFLENLKKKMAQLR